MTIAANSTPPVITRARSAALLSAGYGVTRDDLVAMLGEQTTACGPARDALYAGGTFVIWGGLVPATQLARTYQARLRRTQRRGQPTLALAATVDILLKAAEQPLHIGRIDAAKTSWTYMLFLNASATAVLACTGVASSEPLTGTGPK